MKHTIAFSAGSHAFWVGSRLALCSGALVMTAALAGCSMGTMHLSGTSTDTTTLHIQGTVHGGQQGISNSAINLYAVGGSGYGSAPTSLLTSPVTTDKFGSFNITGDYPCPTSTSLVYITATGGNPGLASGTNNSAIEMVAALGQCGNLTSNTFITINEVSTAAAAFALGQYLGAATAFGNNAANGSSATVANGDAFGAPNTTQGKLGITNAFATVGNLVGLTGAAVTSATVTGAGSSLTLVPETAKLYTIADILAACINSSSNTSTACSTLLADTPPAGKSATNTLEAAVYMSLNPTSTNNASGVTASNISTLYGLETATSPFQASGVATLTSAPSDWTLGIQYQDNAGTFFIKPQNIAVDGLGNVWVLSNNSAAGGLVEVGPTGTPLSNVTTLSEYGPFTSATTTPNPPVLSSPKTSTTTLTTQTVTFTTSFGSATNNPAINPRNLAIDPSNNVWFTQSSSATSTTGSFAGATATIPVSGNVFEVATSSGLPTGSTFGLSTGKSAYGLTIDSSGDVFAGDQSSSSYFGVFEFPANTTAGNSLLTPAAFPPDSTTAVPEYMALDESGNEWFTNGAVGTTAYKLTGATASGCTNTASSPALCQPTGSAYTSITLTGAGTPYSLAEGTTGMWFANSTGTPGLLLVPFAGTASTTSDLSANYFTAPHYPAADGVGNIWVANGVGPNSSTNTTGGSISAITAAGAYISPSNGGSTAVGPGFNHLGLTFGYGTAVDPSGNVWVANNAAFTAACSTTLTNTSNTCSSIFELVGAAAPVVTPIASQSATGPTRP